MKVKFKVGDSVKPSKRGKSYWNGVLGDEHIGRIVTIHNAVWCKGRKLYGVAVGSYCAPMFSYELEKRRSK
jgi:hypothetical protein